MASRKRHSKHSRAEVEDLWGKTLPLEFPPDKTIKRQGGDEKSQVSHPESPSNTASGIGFSLAPGVRVAGSGSSSFRWFPNLPEFLFAFSENEKVTSPVNFRLSEKLGEGGMGIVFSGIQTSVGRDIAVKVLKTEFLEDRDAARRFIFEGQITGRLDHPNILPILDVGRNQKGDLFIAMKKITGSRWDQTFAGKRPKENLEILLRACDAMAYAHSRGVIHRDLKPENVILGEFGEIIITDWGLATSIASTGSTEGRITEEIQAGTPAYMAPEVANCEIASINERTDVYLLGATLYEIWTGKVPHTGKDIFACLEAASGNLIQPVEKTDEIVEIALKAMATDPDERYPTVRDFQRAIQDYLFHAESLNLTRSAKKEFAKVGNHYSNLSRSLALFEEALKLWPENVEARDGVTQTRLQFASAALSKGDLNLGESLLLPECPEHQEMLTTIQEARKKRKHRNRQLQIVSVVFMVFAIAMFFIILGMKANLETERDEALAAQRKLTLEKESILKGLAFETMLRSIFQLPPGVKSGPEDQLH